MASRYVRPDKEAKHHREENPIAQSIAAILPPDVRLAVRMAGVKGDYPHSPDGGLSEAATREMGDFSPTEWALKGLIRRAHLLYNEMLSFFNIRSHLPASDFIQVFQ